MTDRKQSGGGGKFGRNKVKGQTYRAQARQERNKAKRIERDAARMKPRAGCGHAKRYQGKLGCSKCRRANGATMHAAPKVSR